MNKPNLKPKQTKFGSGPTCKHPGWDLTQLSTDLLGRSHRAPEGKAQLKKVIDLSREILDIPENYKIAIVSGSATGATECIFWSLLGARGVDIFAWDIFGKLWVTDIVQQLKLPDVREFTASTVGQLPSLSSYLPDRDAIFTWSGTTAGVCVPNLDWIPQNRSGLTFCDATSAAFCVDLDWNKLDATAFSWQKGLGGEAAHGMIVLSPRAQERLAIYQPTWPIPRIFRLTKNGQVIEGVFAGETLNTPSLLCVEDCLNALTWAKNIGGGKALTQRCLQNFSALKAWVEKTPWIDFLAEESSTISPTSVCLKISEPSFQSLEAPDQWSFIRSIASLLGTEKVACDISNHSLSVPSLRLWAGPTVETSDLNLLFPWIEWAYHEVKKA